MNCNFEVWFHYLLVQCRNGFLSQNEKVNLKIDLLCHLIHAWIIHLIFNCWIFWSALSASGVYWLFVVVWSSHEKSNWLIGSGMSDWSLIWAWHIAMLKFERIFTIFLFILWAFLSCSFKYFRYCLSVFSYILVIFLSMSSWIELIRSMASTKTLLFLSMASITSVKT